MAASALASGTGPRRTASDTVVARVSRPERSIMLASAVGPSSQGVWKTKWSLAETAAKPHSRAASTAASQPPERQPLLSERHQRQMDAEVHIARLSDSGPAPPRHRPQGADP